MKKQDEYGLQDSTKVDHSALLQNLLIFVALPCTAILGMSMATLKIATEYGFHPYLGSPWFTIAGVPIYAPWSVFTWKGVHPQIMDSASTVGCAWFILPFLFLCLCVISISRMKGNKKLHGSARWARKEEIQKMGYFAGKGVYVGGWHDKKAKQLRYLRHNGPEHILCFAPTRSGKGVGLILPTLLAWEQSSMTLDIKGENWALTSGWRKSLGHKVLRFDPSDASGSGAAFNPLEEIRLYSLEAIQDVQNMALMLVDPDGKGLEDHWAKAAFGFFSAIILAVVITKPAVEKRPATLQDLVLEISGEGKKTADMLGHMVSEDYNMLWHRAADFFKDFYKDQPKLLEEWSKPRDERIPNACKSFIHSAIAEMQKKAENEASGVMSTAVVNLALYRDPIVDINTNRSDFHIDDLMHRDEPLDLFLVVPPSGIDRVRPLMRLIVDLIIRRVCSDMKFENGTSVAGYKHRLLLMLDEFTSLGKLPIMEKAIAYIAGYGGKMYIIVQDTKQLNAVYGKDNALMANCHVRIAYAPNDPETADLLSKMTGKTTVVEEKTSVSISKGSRSRSININETERALLTPDECMRLPGAKKDAQGKVTAPGHMLIFTAGQPCIYGMQILYFKDPVFSERSKVPAPGICNEFPAGISDSMYFPRKAGNPTNWAFAQTAPTQGETVAQQGQQKAAAPAQIKKSPVKVNPDMTLAPYQPISELVQVQSFMDFIDESFGKAEDEAISDASILPA